MREKIARFMQGRYGVDELGRFMTGASLVILILELFTGWYFLTLVFWAIFIIVYYRIFSRDYGKRQQENQKFLNARYRLNAKWYQVKNYHIYKCPNCKQKIRIPRGKGKIMVRCSKCNTEFQKRS